MRTLATVSLQGESGKTRLCLNLAYHLACSGKRVCLFDADIGLKGLQPLLGLEDQLTLENALLDDVPIEKALHPLIPGLDILIGGSGLSLFGLMPVQGQSHFLEQWRRLEGYDFLIFDNPGGLTPQTLSLSLSCRELILAVSPKSLNISDFCTFLGAFKDNGASLPPFLVLNKCRSHSQESRILELHESTWLYLGLSLLPLGTVPWDDRFSEENDRREPLSAFAPDSPASRGLEAVAKRLQNRLQREAYRDSADVFWKKTFVQLKHRLLPVGVDGSRVRSRAKTSLPEISAALSDHPCDSSSHARCTAPQAFALDRASRALDDSGQAGHSERPRVTSSQPGPDLIGVAAPDPSMRDLLCEILAQDCSLGLTPRDVLNHEVEADRLACWIVCLERHDDRLPPLAELLAERPAILLSPLRGRELPYLKNITATLPKPFNVADLLVTIQAVLNQLASPPSPSTPNTGDHLKPCSARA